MALKNLIENSYHVMLDQLDDTHVVLLHPASRYRSMLIAQLINDPDLRVFYYALGPDDIKLRAFVASITHDLANQHVTFGRHINILPQDVYENPEANFDTVVDTFVQDLAEVSDERFVLVLDEYDRSDMAEWVQQFVEKLAARLPENGRMVINSRTLPRLPWVSMIAQRHAVMIKDEEVIQERFYGIGDGDKPLEVYALGPGFVSIDNETVSTWEGHLPRLLFFFALDRALVTRAEICQAFWPDLESDQAVNVFHVTKRRLHKALNADVLVHDDGYYHINPEMGVYYDAMEFSSLLMQARNAGDEETQFGLWQRASELYRGPFLQGHNDKWIEDRRESFRAGYLEALTNMANVWVEREKPDQALPLLQKALVEDVNREDLHQELMRLYASLGRRSEAAGHYQRIKEDGVKLSSETHALYKEIMG